MMATVAFWNHSSRCGVQKYFETGYIEEVFILMTSVESD